MEAPSHGCQRGSLSDSVAAPAGTEDRRCCGKRSAVRAITATTEHKHGTGERRNDRKGEGKKEGMNLPWVMN